jgi:hypothetical protein
MRKDEPVIAFSELIASVRFVLVPPKQTQSYLHFFFCSDMSTSLSCC